MTVLVVFRWIPSYDYMTPLIHIPVERTGINMEGDINKESVAMAMRKEFNLKNGTLEIIEFETPTPPKSKEK